MGSFTVLENSDPEYLGVCQWHTSLSISTGLNGWYILYTLLLIAHRHQHSINIMCTSDDESDAWIVLYIAECLEC
jgi:hypothetical protein